MCKDFHSRCDNKGPTVSLFKIVDGDCVGGYTKAQWQSPKDEKYSNDNDAILFNLNHQRSFKNKGTGNEICNGNTWGPHFRGDGGSDLGAFQPFNGNGRCYSWVNEPGYGITAEGGKNMLTNQYHGWFTLSELEVWEI